MATTDLTDLVEPLKREVAVPGNFAASFPNTTDQDLTNTLMDAVGQVQLLGFMQTSVLDVDLETVDPEMSPALQSLVVTVAGIRILRLRLLEINQRSKYQAGPVLYESEMAASTLTEMLKSLERQRDYILNMATTVTRGGTFSMYDMACPREVAFYHGEF